MIRLSLNECPYPPSEAVVRAVCEYARMLNRYHIRELEEAVLEALSKYVGIPSDHIALLPGSESFMMYCGLSLARDGIKVVAPDPTFEPALVDFKAAGAEVVRVRLGADFSLPKTEFLKLGTCGTAAYVPNPNNPTGNILISSESLLMDLLSSFRYLIVDEAYYEFSGKTFVKEVLNYSNLLILRTFSKAFAIAGARIGYVIAAPETLSNVLRFRRAFDIPVTSYAAALGALSDIDFMRSYVREVLRTKAEILCRLRDIEGVEVRDSDANFILLAVEGLDSSGLCRLIRAGSVLVKELKHPMLRRFVRVTVGSRADMEKLVEVIERIVSKS